MKIKKQNWLGLDLNKAYKVLEGDIEYINDIVLPGSSVVAALFKARKPNKAKGHKKYVALFEQDGKVFVVGYDKVSYKATGVLCKKCNTFLYSLTRHNYHGCECENETTVDGGSDYLRYGAKDMKKTKSLTVNIVTGNVLKSKK